MKIIVAKRDLEAALKVTSTTLDGSGSDISTHYVLRVQDVLGEGEAPSTQKVEVLSHSGRVCSSAPLICTVKEADSAKAFSLEGKRLTALLGTLDDVVVEFEYDDKTRVVTASSPDGAFPFPSLDSRNFPYWDETLAEAVSVATLPAPRLKNALDYARSYISDDEAKGANICVTEVREDGTLFATDRVGVALVTIGGLEKSNLRIHRTDVGAVINFLSTSGDEEVEVLEHPVRGLYLRRKDGALFGEARPLANFPNIPKAKDGEQDQHYWDLPRSDLRRKARSLRAMAPSDNNTRVRFCRKDDGPVLMSMPNLTNGETSLSIPCAESGGMEGVPALPEDGFCVNFDHLMVALAEGDTDTVRFGVNAKGRSGFVRLRQESDGDKYLTLLLWQAKY